jgi:hypothetical protein
MGGDPFTFNEQPQQQMLGAYVVMSNPAGFLEGDLDNLLDTRRRDDLLDDDPLVAGDNRLYRLTDLADLDSEVIEDFCGQPITFAEQAQ